MWPNDADGLGWADPKTGQPPMLKAAGYTVVDGGRFRTAPRTTRRRSASSRPPAATSSAASSSRRTSSTSGSSPTSRASSRWPRPSARRCSSRPRWKRSAPSATASPPRCGGPRGTRSSRHSRARLQQLADAWTSGNNKEWNQTLLHYAVFEIVVDALKRTTNVDDKQTILDAIKATDMQTIQGHITWTAGAPLNPVPNVCRTVLVGGMWNKGTDYPFELALVDTGTPRQRRTTSRSPRTAKSHLSSTETVQDSTQCPRSLHTRRSM